MRNLHHLRVKAHWRNWIILLTCGIFALAVLWQLLRGREPSYQGRTLSQWLYQIQQSGQWSESDEAPIRAIGTDAIPISVKWISYEASPLRKNIAGLVGRFSPRLARRFTSYPEQRANRAIIVFRILGPQARAAIPELNRLAQTSSGEWRANRCIAALSHLGPEALPSVLMLVTNSAPTTRMLAIGHLPRFGADAKAAVPALLPMLTDPESKVRDATTNTLLQIAPEVLTNAPPQ